MKLNKLISELGEIKKLLSEIIDTQLWINALNCEKEKKAIRIFIYGGD